MQKNIVDFCSCFTRFFLSLSLLLLMFAHFFAFTVRSFDVQCSSYVRHQDKMCHHCWCHSLSLILCHSLTSFVYMCNQEVKSLHYYLFFFQIYVDLCAIPTLCIARTHINCFDCDVSMLMC